MKDKTLARAVLETLVYSDLFDQPLGTSELHRFLHGARIPRSELETGLENGLLEGLPIVRAGGFLMLSGREELTRRRAEAERISAARLPEAVRYGRRIARLPFVRMVGLTGALAVGNAREADDIDYLVVAQPGRVWTCRLFVIALVRSAALRGATLCPNYFLAADALALEDRSIFTARELAQMVPLSGPAVYERMRRENAWVDDRLPNAAGPPALDRLDLTAWPPETGHPPEGGQDAKRAAPENGIGERFLAGRAGAGLERWEMDRKIRKFTRLAGPAGETAFDHRRVQGHFNGYRARTLADFETRLKRYGWDG